MSKKNQFFNELIVGLFMLAVFALLIFFTVIISGADLFKGRADKLYTIHFDSVGGLRMHDNVVVRGMPVGSVKQLNLQGDGVEVHVKVSDTVNVREGYAIRVASSSLLGGNYLFVSEGEGNIIPPSTRLRGTAPNDWMSDLGDAVGEIKKLISDDDLIGNLKRASQSLADILDRVERGEGTIGKLLSSDDTVYNDISNTVASLKVVAVRLENGESSLGKLVSDDGAVYDSLKSSMAHIETIAERLANGKGTMGRLLSEDDKLYNDLSETIASARDIAARLNAGEGTLGKLLSTNDEVYTNIVAITESLKTVGERLVKGEGTLGKLSADDTLYKEADGLVKDLRQVLDNFRETQPLVTFGSLVLGGL